jgi:hypothetical protein
MFSPLVLDRPQVALKKPVRNGDIGLVPAVAAGLVAGDQQDGGTARVEGLQSPQWVATGLCPERAHFGIAGRDHVQRVPPSPELIGVLDFPGRD